MGLREMEALAVDLERRVEVLEAQPAGDSIGPSFTTIDAVGVAEDNEGPEGEEGPEGPEGPEGEEGPAGVEGKQGKEGKQGAEGKEGKQGPAGIPAADGTYEIFKWEWAKKAGEEGFFTLEPSFQPVAALLFGVSNGTTTDPAMTTAKVRGLEMAVAAMAVGEAPRNTIASLTAKTMPFAPLPCTIHLTRSASANTNTKGHFGLLLLSDLAVPNGGGLAENIGKYEGSKLVANGVAVSLASIFQYVWYQAGGTTLPTSISDIDLLTVEAEYAAGKKGTAGAQFRFPTQAEKEAGTVHEFWWQFLAAGNKRINTQSYNW